MYTVNYKIVIYTLIISWHQTNSNETTFILFSKHNIKNIVL